MAKGIFAELQRQYRIAQREQVKAERQADKEFRAAQRREAQAIKAEKAREVKLAKAEVAERKRLEKEVKVAHVASMMARVERMNSELNIKYDDIDSILGATLDVDDYVDLETLRLKVMHPLFDRAELEKQTEKKVLVRPVPYRPERPKGLFGFLKKKSYAAAVQQAEASFNQASIDYDQNMKKEGNYSA